MSEESGFNAEVQDLIERAEKLGLTIAEFMDYDNPPKSITGNSPVERIREALENKDLNYFDEENLKDFPYSELSPEEKTEKVLTDLEREFLQIGVLICEALEFVDKLRQFGEEAYKAKHAFAVLREIFATMPELRESDND